MADTVQTFPRASHLFTWTMANTTACVASTNYVAPYRGGFTTTEVANQSVVPWPCTAKRLFVYLNTAQPADGSLVITMRRNGSTQGLVISVPSAGASGLYTDQINETSFAAGDLYAFGFLNNSPASVSAQVRAMGFVMEVKP